MAEIRPSWPVLMPGSRLRVFRDLMRHRVQDILLVSSPYDAFILTADGQFDELVLTEFREFNVRHAPSLTHVSTGGKALELAASEERYNLIIASAHLGDMNAITLAERIRERGLSVPVVVLAYDGQELSQFVRRHDVSVLERIFLWQGDVTVLLAIVHYVEDRHNVAHDTGELGVQAIVVIEDNIRYYSSLLPAMYTELMHHTRSLAPEGVNLSHRMMRMQARPKILLCTTYEEAWEYFTAYEENILGVISDIQFPRNGQVNRQAGVEFAAQVRQRKSDIPVMLQSSNPKNAALAEQVGATFLLKGSMLMLHELRQFMVDHFGFGTFVFRMPDGTRVFEADDLKSLEEGLRSVPAESVAFHSDRNHFSKWLKARTEFRIAHSLRPRKLSDFESIEALRQDHAAAICAYREQRNRTIVADFDRATFDGSSSFYRLGGGSLGGKARGLAFVNLLLEEQGGRQPSPDVRVTVPPSTVVGTDVFDLFLAQSDLRDFAIECEDDELLVRRFLEAPFPQEVMEDLAAFLTLVRYPLAVRSSSLLEDSQHQPFSGVYETYILPNNHPTLKVRLHELVTAVRRVYASTFRHLAKSYLNATSFRLEEEKMAVILQQLVGAAHGGRFYPDIGGVARSHNFYPSGPMHSEDGIAAVALGLGSTVVDGGACVRFCPRYPRHVLQFSAVPDALKNSQRVFQALDLHSGVPMSYELEAAEADGTLGPVGSTYSRQNDAIYDGIGRAGARLVTFAPILKHGMFPLAEVLDRLLGLSVEGAGTAVELEFALNLSTPRGAPKEFGFLQLRPLALSRESAALELGDIEPAQLLCRSDGVLGHGVETLHDIVVVDFHRFDRGRSQDTAQIVARFNAELVKQRVPYLLIGVGRWGSREPLLGIPITWDQIAGARVIVEAGFRDFKVTPSQGTHFFQNLSTSNVGYFTVNPGVGEGFVDWDWMTDQVAVDEVDCVRHLRFEHPIVVKMDGKRNQGVIVKPEAREAKGTA